MRKILGILAAAGLVTLGARAAASASPVADAGALLAPSPAVMIHHKPGHHGGPPWMRGRQREDYEDQGRPYETRPRYTREVCRTSYRTVFDRYSGEYISRPVRTCTSEY